MARRSRWYAPAATSSSFPVRARSRPAPISTSTIITISMSIFDYDFMLTAFAASGIVAVLAGIVGVFLVARGQTFAGHALSHVGFPGATAAGLIGISPLWGMLVFTLTAGVAIGLPGERLSARDVAIGIVLALSLGFGL